MKPVRKYVDAENNETENTFLAGEENSCEFSLWDLGYKLVVATLTTKLQFLNLIYFGISFQNDFQSFTADDI